MIECVRDSQISYVSNSWNRYMTIFACYRLSLSTKIKQVK